MQFYVIRHGITEMNKLRVMNAESDDLLAEEGLREAEASVKLIPRSVKYIYTSPRRRTIQTAEIFQKELSLPVHIAPQITEITMGSLAGKSWSEMPDGEELKRLHRSVQFDYTPYGGESKKEVLARVKEFITSIADGKDGEVLVVTHGGIIRILRYLQRIPLSSEIEKNLALLSFDTDKILN